MTEFMQNEGRSGWIDVPWEMVEDEEADQRPMEI